jgi:glutamyl endopeptidase
LIENQFRSAAVELGGTGMRTWTRRRRAPFIWRLLLSASLGIANLAPVPVAAAEPELDPDTILTSDGRTITLDPALSALSADGAETPGWIPKGLKVAPEVERDGKAIRTKSPSVMSIIGGDSRVQVTNTTVYPYTAIVRITFVNVSGHCSGFIIDRDTVITAGHCVYNRNPSIGSTGWINIDQVVPGQNGVSKPFGQCQERFVHSVSGWVNDGSADYDYGMIKLNCTVGFDTGWIGYRHTPGSLDGDWDTVGGYPVDKTAGTQWRDADEVRRTEDRRIFYANDTFGGQSGSPAWAIASDGTTRIAIGIHTRNVRC